MYDDSISTTTELKQKASGHPLYYELAEPVITPITEDLTNLIEVEQGGTLTYANQQGEDYRIALPTATTFNLTEWTQPLDSTHKYSHNGTLLTGASSVDVVGGEYNLIDLTKAFGAGNEPSNPSEVFSAESYEQNDGELVSFGVDEVVNRGRNLILSDKVKRAYVNSAGNLVSTTNQQYVGYDGEPIRGLAGKTITISTNMNITANPTIAVWGEDGKLLSRTAAKTYTIPKNAGDVYIYYHPSTDISDSDVSMVRYGLLSVIPLSLTHPTAHQLSPTPLPSSPSISPMACTQQEVCTMRLI